MRSSISETIRAPKKKRTNSPDMANTMQPKSVRLKSPPKAAKQLSELTPVQLFQKRFSELGAAMHRLTQFCPPPGSRRFFSAFHAFAADVPPFCTHSSKILKQRVLSAPLNQRSFQMTMSVRNAFPGFIKSFKDYRARIPDMYMQAMFGYFRTMQENFRCFRDECYVDPQARTTMQMYESAVARSLREIEMNMGSIFQNGLFETISEEDALEMSERVKTLGRFFIVDLRRILAPCMTYRSKIDMYYDQFREAFLKLVPILSAIPCYRDEYDNIMKLVDPLSEALDRLSRLLGNTPDAIKLRAKPSVAGYQPELLIEEVDPLDEPMKLFSQLLECSVTEDEGNEIKLEKLRVAAREKIESLQTELDRVQKRLSVLEPLNSKEAIVDRFEQIRAFKAEMSQRDRADRDRFMRDVLFRLRGAIGDKEVNLKDDYHRQLSGLLVKITHIMTSKDEEAQELRNETDAAKKILEQHGDGSLVELAGACHELLCQHKEGRCTDLALMKERLGISEATTAEECITEAAKIIASQRAAIDELKEALDKKDRMMSMFHKETMDIMTYTYQGLSHLHGEQEATVPDKLSQVRDGIRDKLEQAQNDRISLHDFVAKLNTVLGREPSDDIDTSMSEIIDMLTVPQSDVFLNTELGASGPKNLQSRFRDFLCQILTRLDSDISVDDLREKSLDALSTMAYEVFEKKMPQRE